LVIWKVYAAADSETASLAEYVVTLQVGLVGEEKLLNPA
jgi:hypothetical protein